MEIGPASEDKVLEVKAESREEDRPKSEAESGVGNESTSHPHGIKLGLIIFTLCLAVFLCGLVCLTTPTGLKQNLASRGEIYRKLYRF